MDDQRDYEEERAVRAEYEKEAREEWEAEQRERNRIRYAESDMGQSTDDFHTYNSRVIPEDDDYEDDPNNHPFDCTCFLCIPGF